MRLGQACEIGTGLTARSRLEPSPDGGVLAIQLRDVANAPLAGEHNLIRFELGDVHERYLARHGDLVFRARGNPNTASVIGFEPEEPVAVILPLFRIRPRGKAVDPEYLAWAINRPEAQRYFDENAQGTSVRMISKKVLEGLEIPLPPIETQRRIAATYYLAARETGLLKELAARREQLAELQLNECAHRAAKRGA